MFRNFLQDLRLYRRLISMQLRSQAQYKLNLVIDIGTYLCMTSLEFIAVLIFLSTFHSLLGWSIGDVALLYSFTSTSFGFAEMIGAGLDSFADVIRRGEFDRLLLRPVSALIQLVGSDFRLRRLGRITQGVAGFVLALHFLPGFTWTPLKLVLIPLSMASEAAMFIAILILGATMCFWTVETTELTNILYYGAREMLGYPITIYSPLLQRFFLFVVPLAFGSYIPACYLLGRPLPFGLPDEIAFASPVVALAFVLVAGIIWRVGVRHYQSTGS